VADAEAAIARFDLTAGVLSDTEALARLLLRAESVASSRIEGLEIGGRRLLRAEMAQSLDGRSSDITAAEVLGNIDAMAWAIQAVSAGDEITVERLLEVHQRLLGGTHLGAHAGSVRDEQNWIGGSPYNPCSAAFVPPPPEEVQTLLADLCAFCNSDSLPAVAQAAIAHAQFETIHPFVDGNGRTGRVLIHLVLRRRGLVSRVIPPVSLVLATLAPQYVEALAGTRYRGAPRSPQAHDGLNRWIAFFAACCSRAVQDAQAFEERIARLQGEWRERLGRVRRNSAADILVERLPGAPLFTAVSAAALASRSFQAVNEAIARLEAAGIISQVSVGRKNRAFEAPEVIDAFTDFERSLASPAGDTRARPPARRVPARRRQD
jgi:Fic family protein